MYKLSCRFLIVVPFALALSGSTLAFTITPTFDSTITSDPNASTIEAGIDAAIARVQADITNNSTCAITFQETTSGLGGSSTSFYSVPYATYKSALATKQILSANDTAAIASLPADPSAISGVSSTATVNVGTTLARTLGIANNPGSDGTISLNTSIMNLSRTGGQNSSFYDLQAVAGHEIDEVLGIGGPGSSMQLSGAYTGQASPTGNIGALDLFRYGAANTRSFTMNPNTTSYFSINSGVTKIVNFNQNGANGADFADWGNGGTGTGNSSGNTPAQLQDAYGSPNTQVNIGTNELTALDVIGYNIAAVPEPGTVALSAFGLLALTAALRRRRAA